MLDDSSSHERREATPSTWGNPRADSEARPLWRRRALWWVLAWGALVRLVVGAQLWRADPLASQLVSDPAYYDQWARALSAGETFEAGKPFWLPPLYPWALGLLYRLTGGTLVLTFALQACLGLIGTYAIAWITERCAGYRAAIAAALLWTGYAPALLFEQRLLGVNAALPLCLLGWMAFITGLERMDRGRRAGPWAILAGALLGLACLARPNLLLLTPAAIAGAWFAGRKGPATARAWTLAAALGAAGFAVGVAPGLVANLERSGQPVLVSANGGINLWFGNRPGAHGTFHAPGPEWGRIELQREVSVERASLALGESVDEQRASAWWSARARSFWFKKPAQAAKLFALKLADHFSSTEFGIQYVPAATRQLAPALWLAPLPFGVLLGLAVLGYGLGGERRVRLRGALWGWLIGALVATLLYFTYSRFRLPWIPWMLPFAGAGAVALLDAVRRRQVGLRPRWIALAAVALLQSFLPFEGDYPAQLRGNALCDAALLTEDPELKQSRLEGALELSPRSARILVELAKVALNAQAEDVAWGYLERARALDLPYPELDLWQGVMWIGASNPELRNPERARERIHYWLDRLQADDPLVQSFESLRDQLP